MNRINTEVKEVSVLLRSIPSLTMTLFIVSVITMNLLANKSINLPFSFMALDCGIVVSWLSFLCMDVITKHFGPKAATQASLVAVLVNLGMCLVFFLASKIPGVWGESYVEGSEAIINGALDGTIGGTWYVLFGSTIAFIVSAIVNNYTNSMLGKISNNNSNIPLLCIYWYWPVLRQSNVRIDCVTPILWMDIGTMCCVCLYRYDCRNTM